MGHRRRLVRNRRGDGERTFDLLQRQTRARQGRGGDSPEDERGNLAGNLEVAKARDGARKLVDAMTGLGVDVPGGASNGDVVTLRGFGIGGLAAAPSAA